MAVSAYKLNKQGDNMQPRLTPLAILNHSVVPAFVVSTGDKNNLLDHMGGGSCPGAVVLGGGADVRDSRISSVDRVGQLFTPL